MDKKARIATIIGMSSLLAFTLYMNYEKEYTLDYSINMDYENPFGRYSNGYVYIGDEDYINSIKDKVTDNDILILTDVNNEDPNITILSSHEISDPNERYEIITILEYYSYLNESNWNRTIDSMRVEWTIHNIFYNLHIERDRTVDVDFENSEEKIYSNKLLQRLIK